MSYLQYTIQHLPRVPFIMISCPLDIVHIDVVVPSVTLTRATILELACHALSHHRIMSLKIDSVGYGPNRSCRNGEIATTVSDG